MLNIRSDINVLRFRRKERKVGKRRMAWGGKGIKKEREKTRGKGRTGGGGRGWQFISF